MPESEYSEHKLEYSFDENQNNKIDNLDEQCKGMNLEPYQFEHEKSQEESSQTHKENIYLINLSGKTFRQER